MKKTKLAILLTLVLVLALQSAGLVPVAAEAEGVVKGQTWTKDQMSLTNLVGYMGPVSQYGVITEHYIQGGHSEANVFADKITRENGRTDPFLASSDTVGATEESYVQATLTLPEVHVADTLTFGLFVMENGSLVEVDHGTHEHRITVDVAGKTSVPLVFPAVNCHDHMVKNLYVRQIENGQPVDPQNTDGMKITYGPPVISERRNSLYLGDITYTGNEIFNLFQSPADVGVCDVMELGDGIKLYRETGDNTYEPLTPGTSVGAVIDKIYIYDDSWPADSKYAIINHLIFDTDGKFKLSESKYEIDVVYLEKPAEGEKNKAEKLLYDLAELSYNLSNSQLNDPITNMPGGTLKDGMKLGDLPVEGGNSTITGSTEDGAVLSLYAAGVTETSTATDFYVNMADFLPTGGDPTGTGWANGGLPIADNEYVILNVVVPSATGTLHMNDAGLELSLRNSDGSQHKTNMWRDVPNLSYSRVIWNPVYWDAASNSYQPFQGTILAGGTHGGIVLAPYADIDQPAVGDCVTLIGESVHNSNGQEIHQTSFQGARTFVRMINEPTTEVRGKKNWAGDYNNYWNSRPEKIKITLWVGEGESKKAVATREVTAAENWEWVFTNLPRHQEVNGQFQDLVYSITEQPISYYDAPTYSAQKKMESGTDLIFEQDVTNSLNFYKLVVAGSKTWVDGNDQDDIRPESITVTLQSRYAQQQGYYPSYLGDFSDWKKHSETLKAYDNGAYENDTVVVSAANEWSWCFDNLTSRTYKGMGPGSKEYVWEYRVVETTVDGYTVVYSNDGDHTDNPSGDYNITNTHIPSKISLKVNKFWLDDNNKQEIRPPMVNLAVRRKIEGGEWETNNVATAQLTAEKAWSWEFKDLPAYDANGNLYIYEVYEQQIPEGYWPEIQSNTDANGNMTFTMYNILKTVKLEGKKVWATSIPDSMKPDKIYVDIMREVRASGEVENDTANDVVVATVSGNKGDYEWSIELPGADASGNVATYYPAEQPVPGFTPSFNLTNTKGDESTQKTTYTYDIINTLIDVDVSATKVWQDVNNAFNTRPADDQNNMLTFEAKRRLAGTEDEFVSIATWGLDYTVNVGEKDNNNAKTKVTVGQLADEENVITFSGLPKYDTATGKEWEYTVVEGDVPGGKYKTVYGDPVKDEDTGNFSITITNSLKGEIKGEKKWEPKPGPGETGYDEITLYLKYNGETVATTTAKKPDYKWEFTGIPENLSKDELAKFTVQEVTVPGYVSEPVTITGYTDNEIVNTKAGASVKLNIEKTVESAHSGFSLPEGTIFTFQVKYVSGPDDGYQLVNNGETTADFSNEWVSVQGVSIKAVQKTQDNDFDPISINFTKEGTYVFEVAEVVDTTKADRIKYDQAKYTVTYTVKKGFDGKLRVDPKDPAITKNGGSYQLKHLTFTNRYDMVNIKGSKLWEDEDNSLRLNIDAGTFKSTYLKLFVNDAENPVTDADLKAWGATCTVNDGVDGAFEWSYENLPAYDANGDMITYVVKEMTVKGYQTFYVNREDGCKDSTDGIYADYTLPENTSVANNIYNVLSKGTLTIDKTVEVQGNAQPDTLPEFQFTITPAEGLTGYHFVDAEGKELTSPVTVAVEKNTDGTITGNLPVTILFDTFEGTSKTFTFDVEEVAGSEGGWTYDTAKKTVTYTVTRNQANVGSYDPTKQAVTVKVDETSNGKASFTNTYKEEEKTSVTVSKWWHEGSEFAQQYDVTNMLELYILTKDSEGKDVLELVTDKNAADTKSPLRPDKRTEIGLGDDKYTWTGLQKLKDGEQYVVKEDLAALYEKYPGYMVHYDYGRDDYANAEEDYYVMNDVFEAVAGFFARKLVDGQTPDADESFTFVVEDLKTGEKHYFKNESAFGSVANDIIIVDIRYDKDAQPEPGKTTVYEYVMYEDDPGDGAYIYDKTEFRFQVTIDLNANTTIKAWDEEKQAYVDEVVLDFDNPAVTFNNKTATSVTIQKNWLNEDGDIAEAQPIITDLLELYILHADGTMELVEDKTAAVKGAPLRPVAEPLEGSEPATYQYVWEGLTPLTNATDKYAVKENIDALREKFPGYVPIYYSDRPENEEDWPTYTFRGYETIEENGSGVVQNSVYDDFFNVYAVKHVDGVEATKDQVFTFELKNTTTGDTTKLKNGDPAFNAITGETEEVPELIYFKLTYGASDLPKAGKTTIYDYELREVDPGDGKYIYDDTVYKFRVTIDERGTTELTYWDEKTQAYTNAYVEYRFDNKSLTSVSVTKEWVGGQYAGTTQTVSLTLYANGVAQIAKPTQKGNAYTWTGLPKYDEAGDPIVYTVKETKVPEGYTVTYLNEVGEDAGELVLGTVAYDGGKIVNTYEEEVYTAKGSIVLEGTKTLEGRALKDDEFSFELKDAAGKVLQTATNDKDGNIVFKAIEYTEADVKNSPIKYTISEVKGTATGMTYAANVVEVNVTLKDDGKGTITATADKTAAEIKFVNTYEEEVYTAKGSIVLEGTKTLEGRALKDGEFSFELYRVDEKAETLIEKVSNKNGEFAFSEIKYTEKDAGKTYTYKVYEVKGNLTGVTYVEEPVTVKVTVTDNGDGTLDVKADKTAAEIKFVNTYEAKGEVTFKGTKTLLGREFEKGDEFTFELLNEAGKVIDTVTINPESGTKADFAFQTIEYDLADAGKTYTYTYRVKEQAGTEDGMTYDPTVHTVTVTVSDAGDGSLKVAASNNANALNFTNTYTANGTVLFTGTKTMTGKALAGDDFTFVLTDAEGKEIETVTNDKDGVIAFSAIQYELEDAGKTFTYKVYEKAGEQKGVTYDETVYTVTVKVEDAGDGDLKVTTSDNATKLNFKNSYEAKAILTMNAYKTVNGYKPTVDQVYDFVLLCDDGTEMAAQNKDEVISFGTLTFDEDDIGKTFIYTVKETTAANELLDVDAAIYQVAVTVTDGGDGNLKLETEILKDGKRANGVVFANTATATLAISKTVKGPGPDKAFDLKVTFIGVDGKELEGVYDYDGDVKGTITSGGVIALKDGQSVTIVGLPEGATYTVEENAGPAYTVTVNGKPIAKAEGTLVGHGKLEFINTVEVTTFSVTKVWEGTDLGAITLTLYADGKQITPQPEVTREGDKYTYYNLPKYNDEGEEIVYSAKERGIDGYIRIYNNVEPFQKVTSVVHDGGTIINREVEEEVHELSFKIRKVWTGVEATEEIPAITLTLYCNGEKLDVPTPKPDSEGWYRYYDLPKTVNGQIAVYTVVEEPIPGYTVTYKTASGEIVEEGVNGGEIINAKIPQTGDPATLGLWLAMMGASAVLLTMLQRRRKA